MNKFGLGMAIQLALLLAIPEIGTAKTPNIDVAVVAFISGTVTARAEDNSQFELKPFSRVHLADQIDLAAGSALKIIYLQSGRAEYWKGEAEFRAGGFASEAAKGVPEVSKLPSAVQLTLARAPDLSRISAIGGVSIRSFGEKPTRTMSLNEIRETYAQLRRELPETDMTPELFLISATAQFVEANPNSPSK